MLHLADVNNQCQGAIRSKSKSRSWKEYESFMICITDDTFLLALLENKDGSDVINMVG